MASTLVLLFELVQNEIDFQSGQSIQFQFQNGIGLLIIETTATSISRKLSHDLLGSISLAITLANDPDNGIKCIKDQRKAIQNMDSFFECLQFIRQTFSDHFKAEVQEVPKHFFQAQAIWSPDLRVFCGHKARQIDVKVVLQLRVLVQIGQHLLLIGTLFKHQVNADFIRGKIPHLSHQRQFPTENDLSNPLNHGSLVHTEWDRCYLQNLGSLLSDQLGGSSELDRTLASSIDFSQLIFGVGDLPSGGKVGALNCIVGNELVTLDFRIVQQLEQCVADLAQVVWWNVGRHSHRDSGCPVEQQVGNKTWQDNGFFPATVIVGFEGDCASCQIF